MRDRGAPLNKTLGVFMLAIKKPMAQPSRRNASRVAVVALLVGAALVVGAIGVYVWWTRTGVFTAHAFQREVWSRPITDAESVTCYRGGMARDIQNHILKRGMSKVEVEQTLGPPTYIGRKNEYRYTLGMCSGLAVDYDDLHVYFDDHDRVDHAAVIRH